MELETITMERNEARKAFLDYRRAVRECAAQKLGAAQREYEELDRAVMQGYKHLAAGRQLLELPRAMADAGEIEIEVGRFDGTTIGVRMPALAICRADARVCLSQGVSHDGGVVFHADERWSRSKKNVVTVPGGTFEGQGYHGQWLRAIVPTIPPPFRPAHSLAGYHLLWEAEWAGTAPEDPALLKHLSGDLYAVLAVWDLTPLEQAVLAGRRS